MAHLLKAFLPIDIIDSFNITFFNFLQFVKQQIWYMLDFLRYIDSRDMRISKSERHNRVYAYNIIDIIFIIPPI